MLIAVCNYDLALTQKSYDIANIQECNPVVSELKARTPKPQNPKACFTPLLVSSVMK